MYCHICQKEVGVCKEANYDKWRIDIFCVECDTLIDYDLAD